MGAKVAMTYVILCSVSALGQFISLFCRWHMVSIGGGFILTMYTTLFTTRFDHGVTTLCTLMTKWEKCRDIKKGMWLQDVQSQTCMPALTALSNVPCHAFKTAYIMGMISVLAFVFNWILMLASCGMLWQYLRGKHKPEYRNISFYLIIAGAILLFIAVMCWSFMALPALDEVSHLFTFIGQPPAGASYGYFWMWFSFIFELVAIALHAWMPLNNEMTEDGGQLGHSVHLNEQAIELLEKPSSPKWCTHCRHNEFDGFR
ncbi:unnamed protein product [Durusdinium trenchii]|uniref:Uncharacterized protein n=1 Tax=Durusdinium trenchii TaxID=1381693 RepID=A0ABP0Q8Z3_9DINO